GAADPRIEAVVAEASFANLREAAYDYAGFRKYPWLGKTLLAPFSWTLLYRGEKLTRFPLTEISPMKAVAGRAFPVLLICDEKDEALPYRHTRMIYNAAHGPKQLWVVPGAYHTAALGFHPEEFKRRVLAFFATYANTTAPPSSLSPRPQHRVEISKGKKQISVAARHLRCPIPFLTVTLELTTYDCYDCLSLPHGTGCLRASHSSLKRRTVSRRRTASVAMVSSRCSPPLGILPSFFLRISASSSSAFPRIPVNGLFSSCLSTSPKSSSPLSISWGACRRRCWIKPRASANAFVFRSTKSAAPASINPVSSPRLFAGPMTTTGAWTARGATTASSDGAISSACPDSPATVSSSRRITPRSEERRVGKEWRSRLSACQ